MAFDTQGLLRLPGCVHEAVSGPADAGETGGPVGWSDAEAVAGVAINDGTAGDRLIADREDVVHLDGKVGEGGAHGAVVHLEVFAIANGVSLHILEPVCDAVRGEECIDGGFVAFVSDLLKPAFDQGHGVAPLRLGGVDGCEDDRTARSLRRGFFFRTPRRSIGPGGHPLHHTVYAPQPDVW